VWEFRGQYIDLYSIDEAHRRYTRRINFRQHWQRHLWQERFDSFSMDETHLLAASRYIEINPVAR
jgi:putative transposase